MMTVGPSRCYALSFALLASVLFHQPTRVHAQHSPTCGWDYIVPLEIPPVVQTVSARDSMHALHGATDALLAWYRRCDSAAGRDAARILRNTIANGRANAAAKGLLGVALLRGPDVQFENAEGTSLRAIAIRSNAENEAVRLLADVVAQTEWPEIAEELARVESVSRNDNNRKLTADVVGKRAPDINKPGVWAALAELNLSLNNDAAARKAAERAIALGSARGQRVAGILDMRAGDERNGANRYLQGLRDDGDALEFYFDDLRLVMGSDERAEWRALSDHRADWIRRKWDWRAQLAGISIAERLAVNQRRLRTAFATYPRETYKGAPLLSAIWKADSVEIQPLDDRGLIYVRLGDPDEILRMRPVKDKVPRRIAWVYNHIGEKPSVFEFDESPDRPGYFLGEPMQEACIYGSHASGRLDDGVPNPKQGEHFVRPVLGDLDDWTQQLFMYDKQLGLFYNDCAWFRYLPLVHDVRKNADDVLHTENALPHFARPLDAALNLYAFRGSDGSGDLVSYVFVDVDKLRSSLTPTGSHRFDLSTLFTAGEPLHETVQRSDTSIVFELRQLPTSSARVGAPLSLSVPSGDTRRISLSLLNRNDKDQGQVMIATKSVPAFDAASISMSDLVIAEPRDGRWIRGTHRLAPYLGHNVPEGNPFKLFFELYGVTSGDSLAVRLTITPGRDPSIIGKLKELISSSQAYDIQFSLPVTVDSDGVSRVEQLIASPLKSGAYVLAISVQNKRDGHTVAAETRLTVSNR